MNKKQLALIALLPLVLSACSIYHVDSKDIAVDYHPSKRLASEVVHLQTVERAHEIIGYVTVNTERRQTMDDVLEKMKREAAILGGDAITNIKTDATGTWKQLPAQEVIGNAYVRANFTSSVIVFK